MEPPSLDLKIIHLLAPIQTEPFWVDAVSILSQNSLVNGFVFVLPLFLYWSFSEGEGRRSAQRLVVTILIATLIGIFSSLLAQQIVRWPPPVSHPALADLYSPEFRDNVNLNSFPSDSTILFSTVALGLAAWNRGLSAGLLVWLLLFVAPLKVLAGGHYPSDILAGLLLGYGSIRAAEQIVRRVTASQKLISNQSLLFRAGLVLWMFEIGNEFRNVTALLHGVMHIQRHL